MNFPFGRRVVLAFVDIDPRVVSRREVWKNREAFERLEMACAGEEYITELHLMHPELIAKKRRWLQMYKKGLPTMSGRQVARSLTFAPATPAPGPATTTTWIGRHS